MMTTREPANPAVAVESSDVCIVGAGVAGLNALFVASQYLSRDQKVILVDRRPRVGGMWVDTYPYVRLHQPHPMFTAGNIAWTLGRDRSYLATQGEVLDHFAYCLDVLKKRLRVDEYFGWEVESHDEAPGAVRVTCSSADGRRLVIETKRLIKAYGFAPRPNDPLQLSSRRVHSVSPNYCDVRGEEMRGRDPVWVIGGGKTAMDTAHALITEYPGREVNLVAGSGTYFLSRDRVLPTGAARWWRGKSFNALALGVTRRFDGTNEDAVNEWFRDTYGVHLTPRTGNFLLGLMSESENTTIAAGLNTVVMDHLVDVVDRDGGTQLVFRSGATKVIEPGSWIVNCTGYFPYRDDLPYEPYASPSGAVLSINPRSATLQLTTFMGYFMTHLMMLGKLNDIPLYELDAMELRHRANPVFPLTIFTLAMHNISLITDEVPRKVFSQCGIDVNRWYPLPRRALDLAQFMLTHRRERERLRRSLDTVRERFDVRCGPLGLGVGAEPVKQ